MNQPIAREGPATGRSPPPQRAWLRHLVLSYGFLAFFWAASTLVTKMNMLWLCGATLALSLPMMAALWHQGLVRRLIALHQFRSGRILHRWGSRRALSMLLAAMIAILLTATTLLQSVFFGTAEWVLLGLSPLLYQGARSVIAGISGAQFSSPLYAQRWSAGATQWLVMVVLVASSIAVRYASAEEPTQPYLDRVHELQSNWAQVPSGTIKWSLDVGAWGQAAVESIGHWHGGMRPSTDVAPDISSSGEIPARSISSVWRLFLALVVAPISMFSQLSLTFAGVSLPLAEVRRTLAQRLTAEESPPAVGPARAAVWAAVAVVCVMAVLRLFGTVDGHLQARDSPFAIEPLPECELIGGKVYKVNTSRLLNAWMGEFKRNIGVNQVAACQKLSGVEGFAEKGVDAYLDWYFSLGAEWERMATMLAGDVNLLLETKFSQLVLSSPEVGPLLLGVQTDYEQQWRQIVAGSSAAQQLLEQNHLVLSEAQCRPVAHQGVNPWQPQIEGIRTRLLTGSGAGIAAGALAAKVSAKAMTKFSMKVAAKVLAKVAAKKGVGMAGGAAAGAVLGSAVPGVGTVVGAVVGSVVGFAVGTGVDMAALALEEKLTRPGMKKELLSAVSESLRPYRETFECK